MNAFFMTPQSIYTEPQYKSLSLAAKTAYMFLADRQSYSHASIAKGDNSWIDNDGNVYCIMTNLELVGLLNMTERSIIKAKDELVNAGLLKQVKGGFNKPAKLYVTDLLAKDELTEQSTENISAYQDLPKPKTLKPNTKKIDTAAVADFSETQSAISRLEETTHADVVVAKNNEYNQTVFNNTAVIRMADFKAAYNVDLQDVFFTAKRRIEAKTNDHKRLFLDDYVTEISETVQRVVYAATHNQITGSIMGYAYKSFSNIITDLNGKVKSLAAGVLLDDETYDALDAMFNFAQ